MSLIVSVYNQAKSLPTLLGCLRRQRCTLPFEVLLCDDGSSDETWALVRDHADFDVRYLWQPDRAFRLSRSRNNGIRCSTGDLLVFLDGDVLVGPDFLASHVAQHDGGKRVVCGARRSIDESAQADVLAAEDPVPVLERYAKPHVYDDHHRYVGGPYPWMSLIGCNFSVVRRPEVVFDENMIGWGTEDREFSYRLHRAGFTFHPVEATDAYHFTTPRGWTHDKLVDALRNKLYLASLYPLDEMAPAYESLNWWFLDSKTDRWYAGPYTKRPLEELLAVVRGWFVRNGVTWPRAGAAPPESLP